MMDSLVIKLRARVNVTEVQNVTGSKYMLEQHTHIPKPWLVKWPKYWIKKMSYSPRCIWLMHSNVRLRLARPTFKSPFQQNVQISATSLFLNLICHAGLFWGNSEGYLPAPLGRINCTLLSRDHSPMGLKTNQLVKWPERAPMRTLQDLTHTLIFHLPLKHLHGSLFPS